MAMEKPELVKKVLPEAKAEHFSEVVARRYEIARQMSELEKQKDALNEEIKTLMAESGSVNIQVPIPEGDYFAKLIMSQRETLSETMLVANGCPAEVIAMSKKKSESVSLRVDFKLRAVEGVG